jgi:hypothetical protein
MAFPVLGRTQTIVQPSGFGEVMGGFTGSAEILKSAPFQTALANRKALEAGIFQTGLQEVGASKRNERTTEATLKIAEDNRTDNKRAVRLAGISQLLAGGGLFGGGGGGGGGGRGGNRFAGQNFGVGNAPSATAEATKTLTETNDLAAQLRRQREEQLWWQQNSIGGAKEIFRGMPATPS